MPPRATPKTPASHRSPRLCPLRLGRHRARSSTAAKTTRTITVPDDPMSSNSVRASAAPNWTDPIPKTTSAAGGTDSTRRLVFVLDGNVLERVYLAEVRTARLERRSHLGVGQLGAAFRAA